MTQQELGGSGTGEPDLTEGVQAQSEAAGEEVSGEVGGGGTEAPALNRAERRAQAKGKKAGAPPPGLLGGGAARGPNPRTSSSAGGSVRFTRTGSRSK